VPGLLHSRDHPRARLDAKSSRSNAFIAPVAVMSEDITRLEEKIAYLERHVIEQDKAMLEFAEDLGRLKRELRSLSTKLSNSGATGLSDTSSPEERPPHY
jgi:SlyX protein